MNLFCENIRLLNWGFMQIIKDTPSCKGSMTLLWYKWNCIGNNARWKKLNSSEYEIPFLFCDWISFHWCGIMYSIKVMYTNVRGRSRQLGIGLLLPSPFFLCQFGKLFGAENIYLDKLSLVWVRALTFLSQIHLDDSWWTSWLFHPSKFRKGQMPCFHHFPSFCGFPVVPGDISPWSALSGICPWPSMIFMYHWDSNNSIKLSSQLEKFADN